jgi:hypothetical protein
MKYIKNLIVKDLNQFLKLKNSIKDLELYSLDFVIDPTIKHTEENKKFVLTYWNIFRKSTFFRDVRMNENDYELIFNNQNPELLSDLAFQFYFYELNRTPFIDKDGYSPIDINYAKKGEESLLNSKGDSIENLYRYLSHSKNKLSDKFIEKAEDVIATNGKYSFQYAKNILQGGFKKGEQAIYDYGKDIEEYAIYVLKDKFDLAHEYLIKSFFIGPVYINLLQRKGYKINNKGEEIT